MANAVVAAKKKEYPDMTRNEIKKASQQALTEARIKAGADSKGTKISITDREWEAIQAGAISDNKLTQILKNTATDDLRQRATPRTTTILSSAKIGQISSMKNAGYTIEEIAQRLGVSTSTVSKYLK